MALNIRGIQPIAWGTITTTGFLTESINASDKTDEKIIDGDDGDQAIQITGFGLKTDVTLEVIPKSSVDAPPVCGDVFGYGPTGDDQILITIISIDRKKMNKDVEKWSIKGNFMPTITLTLPG